jgi:hypothetical protein
MSQGPNGEMIGKMTVHPLPAVDEWGVLSDGSVAFVRGQDYHIDWLNTDDTRTSSGKIPFDWRRLTDDDKQKLVDSAKAAQADREAKAAEAAKGAPGTSDAARAGVEIGQVMTMSRVSVGGGAGAPTGMSTPIKMVTEYVPANELPDYYPPIRPGAVRTDLDGNIWILPTTSAQSVAGELIYDVVNRKGELTHRVRVPAGRSIAGFGKGGTVYLMWRDGVNGWYLERTHVLDSGKATQ